MSPFAGPFVAGALLLAASGVAKLVSPAPASSALADVGLPSGATVVRAWSAIEVVAASWALLSAGRAGPATVSAIYIALALFVAAAVRRGGVASCGCLGGQDDPPSRIHIAIDVGFALATAAVAAGHWGGIGVVVSEQPLGALPFAIVVAAILYLSVIATTALPRAMNALRPR